MLLIAREPQGGSFDWGGPRGSYPMGDGQLGSVVMHEKQAVLSDGSVSVRHLSC